MHPHGHQHRPPHPHRQVCLPGESRRELPTRLPMLPARQAAQCLPRPLKKRPGIHTGCFVWVHTHWVGFPQFAAHGERGTLAPARVLPGPGPPRWVAGARGWRAAPGSAGRLCPKRRGHLAVQAGGFDSSLRELVAAERQPVWSMAAPARPLRGVTATAAGSAVGGLVAAAALVVGQWHHIPRDARVWCSWWNVMGLGADQNSPASADPFASHTWCCRAYYIILQSLLYTLCIAPTIRTIFIADTLNPKP